jgi:hypothetical protein
MVTLNDSARITYRAFFPDEVEPIKRSLEELDHFPQDPAVREKVFKLNSPEGNLYAMKATPQYEFIFQAWDDNNKEVLEIVSYARLRNYNWGKVEIQ